MTTTYWINRKAYRDSVNYGSTCPSVDNLSLGDTVWTRKVGDDGLAIWDLLLSTRATTSGLAIDTWDSKGERVALLNTVTCEV
jgi:hypothetical protein